MNSPTTLNLLSFYATPTHGCSYVKGRDAVTVFADPEFPKDAGLYTTLSRYGFRRSGDHIYRPRCPGCDACVAVRVPVRDFSPKRSQRRAWRANEDISVIPTKAGFNEEHFQLYQRYLASRHAGGGMDNPTPKQYLDFLTAKWAHVGFYELRKGTELLGLAVADRLLDGLSAVYTFYDPVHERRSLGVFAVLWEIQEARRLELDWLYLGYWINDCRKMQYKAEYQPLEYYRQGRWVREPPLP